MSQIRTRTVVILISAVGLLLSVSLSLGLAVSGHQRSEFNPVQTVLRPRVVVLKSRRTLHLFDGDRLLRSYPIELGFSPAGQKRWKRDGRTPTGRFHVVIKNADSRYHRFIGLDYPDGEAVDWGLAAGLISPGEAASIRKALDAGGCPDWGTSLGGGIGIHGHARGYDWTGGCIALADDQVEELFNVLRIGDPIEILP